MEGSKYIFHGFGHDILAHEKHHVDYHFARTLHDTYDSIHPFYYTGVYMKSGCSSKKKDDANVNSNECVRLDCSLMDDAIMHYKKVLLRLAKGHSVSFDEMQALYKDILTVETTARVKGFKTNNCNTYGK